MRARRDRARRDQDGEARPPRTLRARRRLARHGATTGALALLLATAIAESHVPQASAGFSSTSGSSTSWTAAVVADPTGVSTSRTCPAPTTGPTLKGTTSGSSASGATSLTLAPPAGTAVGDVLVAFVTVSNSAGNASASGWSIVSQVGGGGVSLTSLYTILTGAPAASYTFSWGAGTAGSVVLAAYTGADPFSPIQSLNTSSGTGTTATAATATTSRVPGRMVLAMALAGSPSVSDPSGLTRGPVTTTADAVASMTTWGGDITASGTTPAYTSTWTGSRAWLMTPVYLKPPTTVANGSVVTVSWTPGAGSTVGYTVSRSDGATFTVSDPAATSFSDVSNIATTGYLYTVKAAAGSWSSGGSTAWAGACP